MSEATVTVTGLTADRMLQIEAESVVDGTVVDGNLILFKRSGQEIVAGPVRGPAGDGSGPGTSVPEWEQAFVVSTASSIWTITHNQNSLALSVALFDQNGDVVIGNVDRTPNVYTVEWYTPLAGYAVLRK